MPENRGKTKQRGAAAPTEAAFRAFLRADGLLRRAMDPFFTRFGISGSQWAVLHALDEAQKAGIEALRLTDLGQKLLVKPPSITNIVDRLERRGLVVRHTAVSDQRAKQVKLTPVGRKLLLGVLRQYPAQMGAMLAGLNTAEQHELSRLTNRLAAHLEFLADSEAGFSVDVTGQLEGFHQ